jgi:hypothetical protein
MTVAITCVVETVLLENDFAALQNRILGYEIYYSAICG